MTDKELIEMAIEEGNKSTEQATLEIHSCWEEKVNGFLAFYAGDDIEQILDAEFSRHYEQNPSKAMESVTDYLVESDRIKYCEACGEYHEYDKTDWCEDCECCEEGCEDGGDCESGIARRNQKAHDDWVDSEIDRMKEERMEEDN